MNLVHTVNKQSGKTTINSAKNKTNNEKRLKILSHQVESLSQFIVRLSKVYEGALPAIDEQMQLLRTQLGNKSKVVEAENTMSKVTGLVLQNSEKIKNANAQAFNLLESTANTLQSRSDTSVALKQEISEFISQLRSGSLTILNSVQLFDEAFSLYQRALDNIQSGEVTNDESAPESQLHKEIAKEFNGLITQLIAINPDDDELNGISIELNKGLSKERLLEYCLVVVRALMQDVLQERKQAERFVGSLQRSLKKFKSTVQKTLTDSQNQYEVKLENAQTLRNQIEIIGTKVKDAIDLAILKKQANEMLAKMAETLDSREQQDRDEQLELMDLLSELKSHLSSLEKEAVSYKKRLLEQKHHSHMDPLTQIPNRFAYNERIELEFRRWKRHGSELCIAVLDIDHFKNINDNYGHAAGDKTLQVIAQNISKCLRETDFLARWGGEEFVLVLPHTNLKQSHTPLETIRKQIERIPFKFKDKQVTITTSIGATGFAEGDTIANAFERADSALYQAKNQGRNCSVLLEKE